MASTVSPPELLQQARAQTNVNPDAIEAFIYGGRDCAARRREITESILSDGNFGGEDRIFMNHTQRYVNSARMAAAYHLKIEAMGLTSKREHQWAYEAVNEVLPTDVHQAMFIPALEYQTSAEQRDKWLADAKSFRILGAYVQTELGHGSNVRALETTATFDPQTQEFVINTPRLSSTKWWPGGLGKTATHCVLHARLILPKSGDMGVHAFLVQLRELTPPFNHLPGVMTGDIGPKLGFNAIDNGWAQFDQLRIPRENLLAGVAVVKPDGSYSRVPGGDKRMYGAMLDVRASLVSRAASSLARALTIAVRYSLVRLQGYANGGSGTEEVPVMAHVTQRRGLMPWLAFCYTLHFTGERFRGEYERFLAGDKSVSLPALHAESSGLKALVTQRVADGIEACRKLCGGHGYSAASGLPEISNNYLALCTLEGTQQVLEPQTARFILRGVAALHAAGGGGVYAEKGSEVYAHYTSYLTMTEAEGIEAVNALHGSSDDPTVQLAVLGLRAKTLALDVAMSLHKAVQGGVPEKAAFGGMGIALGKLTRAHSQWVLLRDVVNGVADLEASQGHAHDGATHLGPADLSALSTLAGLMGAVLLEEAVADLCAFGVMDGSGAKAIEAKVDELSARLTPQAIALVDGWGFDDAHLGYSAIGSYDGDVYRRLFEYAQQEPLNSDPSITPEYKQHLAKLVGRSRL